MGNSPPISFLYHHRDTCNYLRRLQRCPILANELTAVLKAYDAVLQLCDLLLVLPHLLPHVCGDHTVYPADCSQCAVAGSPCYVGKVEDAMLLGDELIPVNGVHHERRPMAV